MSTWVALSSFFFCDLVGLNDPHKLYADISMNGTVHGLYGNHLGSVSNSVVDLMVM